MSAQTKPVDDRIKLPFAAAQDASKQVLTLTTAIVGVTVTFAKDLTKDAARTDLNWLLAAWVAFAVSALAGVVALLALTGSLATLSDKPAGTDVYEGNVKWTAGTQMVSFGIAMLMTVVFGWFAFTGADLARSNGTPSQPPPPTTSTTSTTSTTMAP